MGQFLEPLLQTLLPSREYSNESALSLQKCTKERLSCIGIRAKEWMRWNSKKLIRMFSIWKMMMMKVATKMKMEMKTRKRMRMRMKRKKKKHAHDDDESYDEVQMYAGSRGSHRR